MGQSFHSSDILMLLGWEVLMCLLFFMGKVVHPLDIGEIGCRQRA